MRKQTWKSNPESAYRGSVPEDASCLLIDSPTTDISEDEKTALIDYLENGGKAMIFSDYTGEKWKTLMQCWKTTA